MLKLKTSTYGNEIEFEYSRFPAGETFLRLPGDSYTGTSVELIYESDQDLIDLLLMYDALARKGVIADLLIKYFPYARQDRVCNKGESHSLQVVAKLINSIPNLGVVTVWDPHSYVLEALFPAGKLRVVTQSELVAPRLKITPIYRSALVAPDAGALKKVQELQKILKIPAYSASKVRDAQTGQITSTKLDPDLIGWANTGSFGKIIIVVDDICDGGRTFTELGALLRSAAPDEATLELIIVHGIFSKGASELLKYYDAIHCVNLMNKDLIADYGGRRDDISIYAQPLTKPAE